MGVIAIQAIVECDGCGRRMRIDIPTESTIPKGWDLIDMAHDAVCGGIGLRDINGQHERGMTSRQDDKNLCPKCTKEADDED